MSSTRPIRALLRGLEVLHVLNSHNGATVSEVAGEIDLPRTTTYRILETLCVAGYAYRAVSDDRYRLTIMVRGLSDGFDDEAWITLIARQYMYELCQEIVWPCAIATISGSTMLVRQTTDHRSPLAVEKRGPGFRVAILGSAAGICYLSFAPKNSEIPCWICWRNPKSLRISQPAIERRSTKRFWKRVNAVLQFGTGSAGLQTRQACRYR